MKLINLVIDLIKCSVIKNRKHAMRIYQIINLFLINCFAQKHWDDERIDSEDDRPNYSRIIWIRSYNHVWIAQREDPNSKTNGTNPNLFFIRNVSCIAQIERIYYKKKAENNQ